MHRIPFQHAGDSLRMLTADLGRIEHGKVARHAGFPAGHPWHQAFTPTAEAGKIVETDGPGDNHPVSLDHPAINPHGNSRSGHTQIDKLFRSIAGVIVNRNPTVDRTKNLSV